MISKEGFIILINAILNQEEFENKFATDLEKYFDGHIVSNISSKLIKTIIKVLEMEMNDKNDGWIEWWLYDAPDAGKNEKGRYVTVDGNKNYELKSVGDLYDFLVEL